MATSTDARRDPSGLPPLDRPYDLTADHIVAFAEEGHVAVTALATAGEVAVYRPAIEAAAQARTFETRPIEERDTYGKAFLQTPNLWRVDPVVQRFVFSTRFARAAAELLGVEGVRLYHDQGLFKEPRGGRTPWHQDQFYWPFDTDRTITMWMPLVDLPPEVGSMTFASGSHRDGAVSKNSISDESDAEINAIIADRRFRLDTHGALHAGDATFHRGWTLHRADPNPTDTIRPVMTIIYVADGARVAEPESPFQAFDLAVWLPGLEPGDLVDTDLNPLLYRAEPPPTEARAGR